MSLSIPGPKPLSDLVREYRRRGGWTQQEVADRAGISVGGLRDLEQRRITRPRGATLRRLAAALELSQVEAAELIRLGQRGPILTHDFCLQVLGPLSVLVRGAQVNLGSPAQRTILAMLALSPGVPVGRDVLADAIWGDHPPPTAENLVQTYLSRLRQRLQQLPIQAQSSDLLVTVGRGYQLAVAEDQLDLLAFRILVDTARRHRQHGNLEAAFASYEQAMGLWRGEPLVDLPGLQAYPVTVALAWERQVVVREFADTAAHLGRQEELLPLLRLLVDVEPLNEAAHARLMIALASTGQQAAALQLFNTLRQRLAEELGVDPGATLLDAHQAILRGDLRRPSSAPVSLASRRAREPPELSADVRRRPPR